MGKSKTKYNWKARQVTETTIDKSEQSKIKLDFRTENTKYDDSNALVLPAKKRKTLVKRPKEANNKLLSKKQRKRLEKIVERKNKKDNRASLIESLEQLQVPENEMNMFAKISQVQTKGLKKRFNDADVDQWSLKVDMSQLDSVDAEKMKINSIQGSRKRMRLLAAVFPAKKEKKDPNCVDLTEEPSSDEELSSDGVEEVYETPEVNEKLTSEENTEVEASVLEHNETEQQPKITEVKAPKRKEVIIKRSKWIITEMEETVSPSSLPTPPTSPPSPQPKEPTQVTTEITQTVADRQPAVFVPVDRLQEVQDARVKLPILAEEQAIMEAIKENDTVILAGETGSGKTTQVPQFLYEAGYAQNGRVIGVTEPRRVAAISMANRVGYELNLPDQVGYLIRFEGNVTKETRIKFMTDGVLLKEIQSDFLLKKYSVIILDEAHERSVYTDILMGLLSRIVPLRRKKEDPLKLIVMSATLKVEDFTANSHLFKTPPPVIKVESRQFPVSIHFNKVTNPDYLREAFKKICRIHTTLPEGGILVFVTGQQEVNVLVNKLKKAFPLKNRSIIKKVDMDKEENVEDEIDLDMDRVIQSVRKRRKEISLPKINLNSYDLAPNDDTEQDLVDVESEEEDWNEEEISSNISQPMWVLPLYSILPSHKQAKVFKPAPEGTRLCVIATNVAETSLTIPGVKYVVDTGKVKTKQYDKSTGVTAFTVTWTSKAGANQRAGRAGRTGPGHCYRLYSSAIYNDAFDAWSLPEMQKRPVDDLILQMKSLGIFRVVNFPFPSPPDNEQLKTAEKRLELLGAVTPSKDFDGRLTELGASMARFPVAPRFAKMLCLSHQHSLLEFSVAIVAAMSVQEVLLPPAEGVKVSRSAWAGQGNSLLLGDAMVLLRAVGAAEFANSDGKLEEFCSRNNIRHKAVLEIRKIRLQLTNEINLLNSELNVAVDPKMEPPSDTQARLLRQIMLSGFIDQVARKREDGAKRPTYNIANMEDAVHLHSLSALYKESPDWVVYQEIYETNKMYMRGVTAVEPEWLPVFAPSLCRLGTPLDDPPPKYDVITGTVRCHATGTFGRSGWELPLVEIEYPTELDKYKFFAVYILDGSVCPKLKKFKEFLLSSPQTMTKSWAKLQSRTEFMLKTLLSKEVDSREKLMKAWETESTYLLSAYQKWLPENKHNEVSILWPPT